MVAGFHRVLASGELLLAATTTTTLVQPTYGFSSTEIAEECATEIEACRYDDTCASCNFLLDETSSAEFNACAADVTFDSVDSSTSSCFRAMAVVCCFDAASDHDCLENDNYVSLSLCSMEVHVCSVDDITCDGVPSGRGAAAVDVDHSSVAAFVCALFVAFLPFLKCLTVLCTERQSTQSVGLLKKYVNPTID